jgi:broad specificity phosphatase PhoE
VTANFLFIRHGAHDYLGRAIAGRKVGVHLNKLGRAQAQQLPHKLSLLPIDAIYSGPLERVRETAEPLCAARDLPLQVAEEFTEIEVGEWTDRPFTELAGEQQFKHFNAFRSSTAAPGGELMLDVQARVVRKLTALRQQHQFAVIVTHGDVVRCAVAHFIGIHLDMFFRIEIDPASLTLLEIGDDFARVRLLNAPSSGSPLELPAVRHQ